MEGGRIVGERMEVGGERGLEDGGEEDPGKGERTDCVGERVADIGGM